MLSFSVSLLLACLLALCPVQRSWGAIIEVPKFHDNPVSFAFDHHPSSSAGAEPSPRVSRTLSVQHLSMCFTRVVGIVRLSSGVEKAGGSTTAHRRDASVQRRLSVRHNLLCWRQQSSKSIYGSERGRESKLVQWLQLYPEPDHVMLPQCLFVGDCCAQL